MYNPFLISPNQLLNLWNICILDILRILRKLLELCTQIHDP